MINSLWHLCNLLMTYNFSMNSLKFVPLHEQKKHSARQAKVH
uniref:Uncharacterized protein n=1 Tax=Anguilla anguilla TaxID=7936 RepID=A0A0E9ULC2_ANGAN